MTTADLSGRRAVITGGASGIGRACATRLAAAGAQVVILDVDGPGAIAVAEAVDGLAFVADLADPASVDDLDVTADILVNNAGVQYVAPVQEFPPEEFARMLAIMVESPFRLLRRLLPGMYERGWGRVINISSVHGHRASPYKSGYTAAKHAVEGLSKVIALEGAPHGVTSNCVSPAYVRTPLVENQIADQARAHGMPADEVVERIMLEPTAIKRLIEPDEVAELVGYLCSPSASFITGASIPIDGAWMVR